MVIIWPNVPRRHGSITKNIQQDINHPLDVNHREQRRVQARNNHVLKTQLLQFLARVLEVVEYLWREMVKMVDMWWMKFRLKTLKLAYWQNSKLLYCFKEVRNSITMVNVKMLYICHGINVVTVLLKVGSLGYSQIITCVPTSDFVHMSWNKRGYVF